MECEVEWGLTGQKLHAVDRSLLMAWQWLGIRVYEVFNTFNYW